MMPNPSIERTRTGRNLPVRFSLCVSVVVTCASNQLCAFVAASWITSLPHHVPVMGQLLDVMQHAIELPLPIDLGIAA